MSLVEPAAALSLVIILVSGICAVAVGGVNPTIAFPMAAVGFVSAAMVTAQLGLTVSSILGYRASRRGVAR